MTQEIKDKVVTGSFKTIVITSLALISFSFGLGINVSNTLGTYDMKIAVNAYNIELQQERYVALKEVVITNAQINEKIYDLLLKHVQGN